MRFAALCFAIVLAGCSRTERVSPNDSTAVADSSLKVGGTKLQRFSAKTGAVIIKGFESAGVIRGLLGTSVSAEARELTDAVDGSRADGIAIEVTSASSLDRSETSFVDYDEIESLVKGLDYIARLDSSVTKLSNFQADYATRGDLRVSTFNDSEGKISMAVKSGTIGGATAYLSIAQAPELKALIAKAKSIVEHARPITPKQ